MENNNENELQLSDEAIKAFTEAAVIFTEEYTKFISALVDSIVEAINSIDWAEVVKEIQEANVADIQHCSAYNSPCKIDDFGYCASRYECKYYRPRSPYGELKRDGLPLIDDRCINQEVNDNDAADNTVSGDNTTEPEDEEEQPRDTI